MNSVNVLGVRVDGYTALELQCEITRLIESGVRARMLHVNAHGLNLAYELPWFSRILNSAEVVFCDGAGVRLAARILGKSLPERITYADWIWPLAALVADKGFSIFLLGGREGVAQQAADRLLERTPDLRIVGAHHGYFDKARGSAENAAIVRAINAVRPHLLLVAFGMPEQERWLMENWDELDVNVGLTGGAVFDYVSDNLSRAPRVLTANGFEWVGRLAIEPARLGRRYLVGNPLFVWRVLAQRRKGRAIRKEPE